MCANATRMLHSNVPSLNMIKRMVSGSTRSKYFGDQIVLVHLSLIQNLFQHMEWDPCGDDFGYAEKWSKQFIDANDFTEKHKTKSCLERANNGQGCTSRRTSRQIPKTTLFRKLARIQMSLKNNDVGRQVK